MGIRCADHVTPLYPQKLALTSPTGGGRSVGIVRSRTKATEFSLEFVLQFISRDAHFGDPANIKPGEHARARARAHTHTHTHTHTNLLFVRPCITYNNISNQLDATITVY